eukprot:GHVS01031784.1.p1 GENE.GHVS01031784.1~~GHVS01031784.1.p1  ORF type:complete len:259 (-),score=55.07 GHVS01031784.1:234-968(-)
MAVALVGRSNGEWKALKKFKTCLDSPYMITWPDTADSIAHDELLQAIQQHPPMSASAVRVGINATANSLDCKDVDAVVLFTDTNCAVILRHLIVMCALRNVPFVILDKQSDCHSAILQVLNIPSLSAFGVLTTKCPAVVAAVSIHTSQLQIPFIYPIAQLRGGRQPLQPTAPSVPALLPTAVCLQESASILFDMNNTKRKSKRKQSDQHKQTDAAAGCPTGVGGVGKRKYRRSLRREHRREQSL